MPLPQKVIEQLGREPPKTPGWSGHLLMFSGTIFAITLFIYLGLAYGYESYLQSGVKKLQDQIQAFGRQISPDEQAKLVGFYSQIANLRTLLSKHVVSSRAFAWLEKNTQANVYYASFDLDVAGSQLTFAVKAKTMADVLQQIAIFENLPEIGKLRISNVSLGSDGWWQFSASIVLPSGYFNYGDVNNPQGG